MMIDRRLMLQGLFLSVAACSLPRASWAAQRGEQEESEENGKGVTFGEPVKQKWRVGMVVRAVGGPCRRLYATIPVPAEWPEQEVQITDEQLSPHVKAVTYRMIDGGAKQMLVSIPSLPANDTATCLLTFEVWRKPAQPPEDTSLLKRADKVHSSLNRYLQTSPLIESKDKRIVAALKEILADKHDLSDWQKVEVMYDWVRENVKYQEGKIKGALAALQDGTGDCEELTSLFIALCRAAKIPARTVWVPGHCYPEFYLVDDEGQGHWIPCQIAGAREFGKLTDPRPVLQKGDNFKVPEKKERQRYVAEFLKGKAGGGDPQVTFHRDLLPAD